MLSRVADCLYWISRNIERAENTARMIDVNLQLLLDHHASQSDFQQRYWRPILAASGDEELYRELYGEETSSGIAAFLTNDTRNANSIVQCIATARENARMIRDQLSEETWEEINGLYLFLRSPDAERLRSSAPFDYYQRIRNGSLLFQAIVDTTTARDEGWEFLQLGRFLERADKTSRLLDILTYIASQQSVPLTDLDSLPCIAILRSCSAYAAYRWRYKVTVTPRQTVEFLMFSEDFPRSVRFCLQRIDSVLHAISGTPQGQFSNDAERISGMELAKLNFGSIDDSLAAGLHEQVDALQVIFNAIGDAIFRSYVLLADTFVVPMSMRVQQQQQQQQQQQGRLVRGPSEPVAG